MHRLKDDAVTSIMEFSNWALANPTVNAATWFTDEAHFHLSSEVNTHTLCY